MTKRAELANGTILEFPDDTPDDVIDRTVRQHVTSPEYLRATQPTADFSGVSSRVLPEPEPSIGDIESRARGLTGRTLAQGAAGLVDTALHGAKTFADQFAPAVGLVRQGVERATGFQLPSAREAVSSALTEAGVPQYQGATERVIGNVGEALTGTAGTFGLNTARALPQLIGASTGAGSAGVTRELGGGQTAQTVAGLAGALAPSAATIARAGASGALRNVVDDDVKEIARQARERGINLTPAQLSDSRFIRYAQSWLRNVPFTGAQGRYQKQVDAFNRALAEEIGENAGRLSPEVVSRAKSRQSAKFDELTSRNALRVDDKLISRLSNIADSASISPDLKTQVENAIDSFYTRATTGPGGVVVPGAAYQAFDSELNQIIKTGGPSSYFLGNVQRVVRDAMDASIRPEDAQAWRQLRREYGARKTLAPAASKSVTGEISPAQVTGAVTATKSGKEAQSTGRTGGLGQLARIGQLMKEPPSSGTSERVTVGTILGGGAVLDPVTGGLTAVGLNLLSRGFDSRQLADILISQNPGLTREAAMQIVQRSAVPAAIVTEQNRSR